MISSVFTGDMVIIPRVLKMLNEIKIKNEYRGVSYNHPGPAHLSDGTGSISRRYGV